MMKRGVIVLILLGILLVSPLVLAQEQAQIYSSFDRFLDNVKMFFSSGDRKVTLALEIREKELNSAVANIENGNEKEAEKNLERAWERLQFIQERVSFDTAEEVKENSNELMNNIINRGDLPNNFDVYVLEEEKTGLTAEWVIEVNGKEGQDRVLEIEKRIVEIDNGISNWVVKTGIAGGDDGLALIVKTEIAKGDNGLKPEVKIYVEGDGTEKNDPLPEPDLNKINPDISPTDTTKNEIEGGVGENNIDNPAVDDGVVDEDTSNDVSDEVFEETESGDVGGVDEGPGEPGVVDED